MIYFADQHVTVIIIIFMHHSKYWSKNIIIILTVVSFEWWQVNRINANNINYI